MIISRTPFRISFAGGGSDLPAFYRKGIGAVLSTSIDKYMYIAIHPFFDSDKIQLKYSKTELVNDVNAIQHPIFKEVLKEYNLKGIDLNSIADIPAGTGLGSSSAFTVGLLNAVRTYLGKATSGFRLGELACEIELNKVGSPIGKQDQFAAACGGLNFITFYPDESVNVEKIILKHQEKEKLQNNLYMIYLGGKHSANDILINQQKQLSDKNKFENQKKMVELAYVLRDSLERGFIDDFGKILHEGWMLKKSLSNGISSALIDELYNKGLHFGATGGKLLGAGGAGFMLFYCPSENKDRFLEWMKDQHFMKFRFDNYGSKIIYIGDKYE